MKYIGNWPGHFARNYTDRRYTHTKKVKGRDVNFFDCWTKENEPPLPTFSDELNIAKIRIVDNYIAERYLNERGDSLYDVENEIL
jgi:hypothetical protein